VGGVVYAVRWRIFPYGAEKDKDHRGSGQESEDAGKLTHDESGARIDWNMAWQSASRRETAPAIRIWPIVFIDKKRLYQLQGTYPAVNSDPNGSSGMDFIFSRGVPLLGNS